MYPDNEIKSLNVWKGIVFGRTRWGLMLNGKYYDLVDGDNKGINSWFELPHDVMIENLTILVRGITGGGPDQDFSKKILENSR